MNTVTAALDALLDPAAPDAQVQRARLDGHAWGLCAVGADTPQALLDGLPAGTDPAAATRLLRAHRKVLRGGGLPEPALPAPEAPIAARTAALGAWCGGALRAVHDAAPDRLAALDPDALEAYGDLAAVAGVAPPARGDEAAEVALAELTEHARVALALLASALAGPEFMHAPD